MELETESPEDSAVTADPVTADVVTADLVRKEASAIERATSSKWLVLLMCFGVLGVLGVPLICFSRAFTRREKVVWSVIVTLYTIALIALTVAAVWFAWHQFQQL